MPDFVAVDAKEYDEMIDRLFWLDCLEDAGVDNWSGIEFAREMYNAGPEE